MRYRSDIDGLRAVAVLSVVLYHLGFARYFGGGFVGVDVFFVISGYLITGILQGDVDAGRLSIAQFYDRRVRRIFPALFVVYAFCLVSSGVWLLPSEAREVGHDVLASLAFVSNVVYCHGTGYFDQTVQKALLLHTWSLSVEEQFYVGLPLLLLVLGRTPRRVRLPILAALAVVSFALATWMVGVEAPRAFYLVHYRAWELLLGALLAHDLFPAVRGRALAEVLGLAGLGLILFGVYRIGESTPFPGVWALPPCVGAAALIHAGREARPLTARLLGSAPFRLVGLVSYSLYLWHWPLIALFRARSGELTASQRWEIVVLAAAASALSYRYVEIPFRRKPHRRDARATLSLAAVGMAVMAGLAFGVPAAAERLRPGARADEVLAYLHYPASKVARSGICFLTTGYNQSRLFQKELCLALRSDRKNVLVMGDSHAAHLWPGLQATRPDINFLQATASGCGAFIRPSGAPRCQKLFAFILHDFLPKHRMDAIVYHGRWTPFFIPDMERTIEYLRKYTDRVVVIGPPAEYDEPLPRLLSRSILEKDPALPARHLVAKVPIVDRTIGAAIQKTGAEYHSIYSAICPNGTCTEWAAPGVPVQYDYGHLTEAGSKLAAARLAPQIFR